MLNINAYSILKTIEKGNKIHKPTKGETEIIQVTCGSFTYSIGKKGSKKKVTKEELEWAIDRLNNNGYFIRKDYEKAFPKISNSNPCNFTSIGGVLVTLGYANYERGKYSIKEIK